jgi:hypothetical protein
MVGFEISVNGHHIRTISVGEFGMLTADVMWARIQQQKGTIHEEFRVMPSGLEGRLGDSVRWPDALLKIGDSVTVRIVEIDAPADPPTQRTSREALREMAKRQTPPNVG